MLNELILITQPYSQSEEGLISGISIDLVVKFLHHQTAAAAYSYYMDDYHSCTLTCYKMIYAIYLEVVIYTECIV